MTPEQIALVRNSFSRLPAGAGSLFYQNLFSLDPSLRSLFGGDIEEQGRRLLAMIGIAVKSLDDFDAVRQAVQDLGRRHRDYGVQPQHYGTVASALLETLGQGLGEDFDGETRDAWVAVYDIVATTMIDAAGREAA